MAQFFLIPQHLFLILFLIASVITLTCYLTARLKKEDARLNPAAYWSPYCRKKIIFLPFIGEHNFYFNISSFMISFKYFSFWILNFPLTLGLEVTAEGGPKRQRFDSQRVLHAALNLFYFFKLDYPSQLRKIFHSKSMQSIIIHLASQDICPLPYLIPFYCILW